MEHKHFAAARAAYYNISFSPDKRAEHICAEFDNTIKELKQFNVEQRCIDKYERLWLDWLNAKSRCLSSMITGPANFPAARNDKANAVERKKQEALIEYYNKIIERAKRDEHYKQNPLAKPVMLGDKDALQRLQDKLKAAQKAQETMKEVNKILRKKPIDKNRLKDLLGGEKAAQDIIKPDHYGRAGFPAYALNNNRAEIKRLEGRIKSLEARKAKKPKDITINGVRVIENVEDMRLQIFFNDKPNEETRSILKGAAFRWSPKNKAWQRKLTNNAIYDFKRRIVPVIKSGEIY